MRRNLFQTLTRPLGSQGRSCEMERGDGGMCLFRSLLSSPSTGPRTAGLGVSAADRRGSSPTPLPPPPPSLPTASLYPSAFLTPLRPAHHHPHPLPPPSPLPHSFPLLFSPFPSPVPPLPPEALGILGKPACGPGGVSEFLGRSLWFQEAAALFQPLVCTRDPGHGAAAAPLLYPPPHPRLPADHHPGLAHQGRVDTPLPPGQSPSSPGHIQERGPGFQGHDPVTQPLLRLPLSVLGD